VNPETKKKRNEKEKARFLTPRITSNKATLAPKGSPNDDKSLAATRFDNFLSFPGSKEIRAGITPYPFKGTEGLLSKN
jgi:hypothetical protein